MADEDNKKINIHKIYLKDVSLESPKSPEVFSAESASQGAPQVDVKFNIVNQQITEDDVEVVLTLTVDATRGDEKIYLVELEQAGIFGITGFEAPEKHHIMGAYAPEVLFPYAREGVDSLLVKAGFPPLNMGPVNFEQFYRHNLQQQLDAVKEAQANAEGADASE